MTTRKPKIVAQDIMTESQALDAAQQKATPAESESTESQPESAPQAVTLSLDQLQALVGVKVEEATQSLRQEVAATQAQLVQVTTQKDNLEGVFKVLGVNVNTQLAAHRDRPSGLAADFFSALDSAPSAVWVNKRTGQQVIQRDTSAARHLFFTQRDQLRRDLETHAREHGLLQGGGRRIGIDTPTVKADISPYLLDYLSMVVRDTHRGRYVWWQFPFYELELGRGPGDTIQVSRQRWITEPTSVADRTLTPGTALTANRQNISASAISITLGERGLGSGSPASSQPVSIPEFLMAYSMFNLETAVWKVLGHDYEVFEDISIRSRAFATTRLLYNDRQSVTTIPGDVGANDDGTLTENFANNAYAYASGQQIPPLDDGHYIWVVHDTGLAQLKNSMGAKNQYLSAGQVEELTALLSVASNREMGRISGYAGSACGFHFFATNAHSMGAAGTEGVQNETLGVGSRLTRSSFILGQAAIARAQGMEAQIRRGNDDDFQRANEFTWISHETTADLDVDPAINAEQQLRVLEVRTTDVSV